MNRLWMRLSTTVYRRVTVLLKTLDEPAAICEPAPRIEIGALRPDQIEHYRQFRPSQGGEAIERIALGHTAIVAWHEGRIAGAAWVACGRARIPYMQCEIVLPADAVYMYDDYTCAKFRRSHVAVVRQKWLCEEFLRRGFDRSYAVVAVENQPGLGSALKSGYRPVGTHSLLRLGLWKRRWHEPASPDYPVFTESAG